MVAVRSGHKVSKSVTAACVALWFFSSYKEARVVVTAPTAAQIRRILWRELRLRSRGAKIPFPHVPEQPDTGITSIDGTREIVGVSTDQAERMQGFSSPNMLYIIDEGSGVTENIFEAIEGNLAGGARVLMLGNPTQPTGTFYDVFNKPEVAAHWHTLHISSWDAARSKRHIPGMATEEWCQKMLDSLGHDHPTYQVRVLGDFAQYDEVAVVPRAYIVAAQERWKFTAATGRLELGVDVARFGDDETVIAVRRGKIVIELIVRSKLDEQQIATLIEEIVAKHSCKGEQRALVKIDAAGGHGQGAGVVSVLRTRDKVDVIGINGGDRADNDTEVANRRAQLWFALAEWLKNGGAIPNDTELTSDLLAPRYDYDEHNRRRIESKKDIKRRLHRSPDRGDAVALAVFGYRIKLVHPIPGPRLTAINAGGYRWGQMGRGY